MIGVTVVSRVVVENVAEVVDVCMDQAAKEEKITHLNWKTVPKILAQSGPNGLIMDHAQ